MISAASLARRVPLIISVVYALASATWIFTSDRLLVLIAGNYATYQALQTYKGWAFITASAVVLYIALRYAWRRIEQANALLGLASEIARLGGWRSDLTTGKVEATQGVYTAYAMPPGPFMSQAALSCYKRSDRASLIAARERAVTEGLESDSEFPIIALDGTAKWVRVIQRPEFGPDGKPIAVVGAVQDISEIVALRDEAEIQVQRVRNMIDNMPDAFFLLDRDMRFTYANAAGVEIFRQEQQTDPECLGRTFWDVFPQVDSQMREPIARLLADQQPVTVMLEVSSADVIRRVHAFCTPDGIGMHMRDVTEEVRAQNRLRDSEERFRLASMASQDVLYDWDIVNDDLVWSGDATRQRFGFDASVFPRTSDDWLSRVHPDDRDRIEASAARMVQPGQPDGWNESYRLIAADGRVVHVMERGLMLRHADGRAVRMIGTVTDVTALHEEELRLRAIIDVASDAIYEFDPIRRITFYSDGIRTTFGHDWTGEQSHPTSLWAALHRDDRERVERDFSDFCAGREMRWRCEYRMARADGNFANVREKAVAVRDDAGRLIRVIGSIEDVTKERRAEERIRQVERIEAIGQLTGGVAHDFNNLLTVILGNAELLESDDRLNMEDRRFASVILRAAERGAELTAGLLAFAGKQPLAPKTLDTRLALAEIGQLLERTLPANIQLQILIPPELWLVEADPAQLNAAILNLAVNARDAMPEGGKLLIECANAQLDESYVDANPDASAGDFLRIAVTDTGTGMAPEIVERVFEPFFTTKPRGAGTGMGLSMVHGFVLQSGGHVKVYTEPDHGTTISLYLPRSRTDQAEPATEPVPMTVLGCREHVLIVEDNPLLLPHVTELVAGLGYRVSAAADATAALAILQDAGDVDVLFTDVVLRGEINGPRLAALAVAAHPGLKVLFTSGYTENAIVHHGRLDRGVKLLSKPYRRHVLATKLRQVIEGTA